MEKTHNEPQNDRSPTRYYYVDEAGDANLFNRKGRVLVGSDGCSRFFLLGKIEVPDPDGLAEALTELRLRLLTDPYFARVPSMMKESRKTWRMFHAKDDVPEVRQRVFELLRGTDIRFFAHVRDKMVIVRKVLEHNQRSPTYRYRPNDLYDRCVPHLFENRLHKGQAYRIVFAKRGSSDRTLALERGLMEARSRFRRRWNIESVAPIEVVPADSAEIVCLQAADYFLWALQRCFEYATTRPSERRYIDYLWDRVGLIVDRDDTSRSGAGEYYTRSRPFPDRFRFDESSEPQK